MNITRKRTRIHKNEVLESIIVREGNRDRYYSHTYLVRTKGRNWTAYVKWDNWDRQPHVDKYDGSGVLVEQKPCNDKSADEVLKLVRIFRKNLLTMDLTQL